MISTREITSTRRGCGTYITMKSMTLSMCSPPKYNSWKEKCWYNLVTTKALDWTLLSLMKINRALNSVSMSSHHWVRMAMVSWSVTVNVLLKKGLCKYIGTRRLNLTSNYKFGILMTESSKMWITERDLRNLSPSWRPSQLCAITIWRRLITWIIFKTNTKVTPNSYRWMNRSISSTEVTSYQPIKWKKNNSISAR